MTNEEINKLMASKPIQLMHKKDELSELCDRWVSSLRHNGHKLIDAGVKEIRPDLFDTANEIEAFFVGLKTKK